MLLPRSGYYLTLRNRDTGEVYARYKMGEGDRFSVTFIHSVNKYPLTDTYEIENKTIYVEETTYCSFGAGVQSLCRRIGRGWRHSLLRPNRNPRGIW